MNVRTPMVLAALLLAVRLPVIAGQNTQANQTQPTSGQSTDTTKDAPKDTAKDTAKTESPEDKRISELLGDIQTKLRDDHKIAISCKWDAGQCGPLYVTATSVSTIELSLEGFTPAPTRIRMTAGENSEAGDRLCSAINLDPRWKNVLISVSKGRGVRAKAAQTDTPCDPVKTPPSPEISLVTRGDSARLLIEIGSGTTSRSLSVPLVYQRWFADTGGLIAFNLVRDERLRTTAVDGKVKITDVVREERVEPTTGITVNLHPSFLPKFAAQFALSVGRENSRSYFLGAGWRLREAGERALATFSIGLAATEVKRFPGARKITDPVAPDSEVLKPSRTFAFGPYIGLSLGFSFGNLQPANSTRQ